jgi:hypothetical protein
MILFLAWKSKNSGLGHYKRTNNLYNFIKKFKKSNFLIFDTLDSLLTILKKTNKQIIFLDTYIFSKKIEHYLRKNFKKTIIQNDFQFKIPIEFYQYDSFKYAKEILATYKSVSNKNDKCYFGQNYSLPLKKKKNNKKINRILIILNNKKQLYFFKKIEKKIKETNINNKIIININNKKVLKILKYKKDWKKYQFVKQETINKFCEKSKIIICPGGQTLINILENNCYPNVVPLFLNQNQYIHLLNKNKKINLLTGKNKLEVNKKNYYINYSKFQNKLRKKYLLKIFN